MSRPHQLVKAITKFSQQFIRKFLLSSQKCINWLLRTIFRLNKKRGTANAGFVLPTVAMVSIVVVLLTTAILFRSFERAKNASNVRVNTVVINAATPAIDRARAKLDTLLSDPTLPRGTPSDTSLYSALQTDKYRLGDETRLKLSFDINNNGSITTNTTTGTGASATTSYVLENDETLKSAWKFALDTDNNGSKDTFTLYGIYFRSPSRDTTTGQFNRERNPLDARTPPMDNSTTNTQCNAVGFASLVGSANWFKLQSGNLGKSFFVYVVNVPITQSFYNSLSSTNQTGLEVYKGNQGIVALEFEQDRTRIPLPNNAVWFENDLEILLGKTSLALNGRLHTNGNLLVGVNDSGSITFRQVSAKKSCFYTQENGLIIVGGNVGNGSLTDLGTKDTSVVVDRYQGFGNTIAISNINNINRSTDNSGGSGIGFNDAAYSQRIAAMKTAVIDACSSCKTATTAANLISAVNSSGYPSDVINNVKAKVNTSTDNAQSAIDILNEEIEIYLRNRTRRVPFAEEADATGGTQTPTTGVDGFSAIDLQPQKTWRDPIDSSNKLTATTISLTTSQLQATNPNLEVKNGKQDYLGDRVLVGNNLPAYWLQGTKYVSSEANQLVTSSGAAVNWTNYGSESAQRWRNTQIQAIADLGISDRNGFWEESAATNPLNTLDNMGGVRIITGAGIYVDDISYPRANYSFLPAPPAPADNTKISV